MHVILVSLIFCNRINGLLEIYLLKKNLHCRCMHDMNHRVEIEMFTCHLHIELDRTQCDAHFDYNAINIALANFRCRRASNLF